MIYLAAAVAAYIFGTVIAYSVDVDPTGTRKDKVINASLWPLWFPLIVIALIALGAGMTVMGIRGISASKR